MNDNDIERYLPFYLTEDKKISLKEAIYNFRNTYKVSPFYTKNTSKNFILQGDIYSGLDIFDIKTGQRRTVKGIILSNSCDVSLENKRDYPMNIVFAPILKLSSYISLLKNSGINAAKIDDKIEAIRQQNITNIFYLLNETLLGDEYIVLLDNLYNIPIDYFYSKTDKNYICSLTMFGFYLFLFKISVHFCRFHEELDRV